MALMNDIIPLRGSRREVARRDDPFTHLRLQLNHVFDDAMGLGTRPVETSELFAPQLDITETDKEIKVSAELPGIEAKHLDVNVTNDELPIRGEKRSERDENQQGRHCTERIYDVFERVVPLPTEVNGEKAKSEFKNGVLRITLPKREGAKARAHEIKLA